MSKKPRRFADGTAVPAENKATRAKPQKQSSGALYTYLEIPNYHLAITRWPNSTHDAVVKIVCRRAACSWRSDAGTGGDMVNAVDLIAAHDFEHATGVRGNGAKVVVDSATQRKKD